MGSFDIITLVFLGLAVFVIFKLRSVLGERTGAEPPTFEGLRRDAQPASRDDRAANPPQRDAESPIETQAPTSAFRWEGFAEKDTPLAAGFDAIATVDPSFQPQSFVPGAKAAYEMIVTAFNNGDRKTLKNLLSRENFDAFSQDITEREARGETVQANFVSIDKADIVAAGVKGRVAELTVNFVSQMISATKDRNGAVVDGSVDQVAVVTDTWTFARDTSTKDPNWRLVATGG
ncbi:Tim44/TimA family putative adaptor protein [Labrys portucalensis]|uniref:Tim44/TimA family putative adaptor protein n=1 Tax=Labrys neptuniae TaxID=376174 RepID=A0ABV3PRZ7_9HYPH|nr:Tim44/TimA family putative adaptor protein [Labrys neptuniae]MDT3380431.1 Tim44/TimA family putative adaptor protein [Labrys neptuniae]